MTIHLSLYREFFEAILEGTKRIEYRRRCPHWDNKFLTKNYDRVRFVNGYGGRRPWMECEIVRIDQTDQWEIRLGRVLETGNIHLLNPR